MIDEDGVEFGRVRCAVNVQLKLFVVRMRTSM